MFQLQFHKWPESHSESIAERLAEIIRESGGTEITQYVGVDNGPFLNVNASVQNAPNFWKAAKEKLEAENELDQVLSIMIIVCEGNNGWDDYRLLHHFNSNEIIDDPPSEQG